MRVLIVDDHDVVRDGLRYMLADEEGIEIVADVGSAEKMLEIVDTEPVDVVLLDIRMKGMSGLDALTHLAQTTPQVRAVMLSMHDQPGYLRRALELGASGYLLKSSGRDAVLAALRAAAEGDTYVDGSLVESLVANPASTAAMSGRLSPRERQVLVLIAGGAENKQIARELGISEATVKTYVKGVFERLGVSSRAEAVAVALRTGIIE